MVCVKRSVRSRQKQFISIHMFTVTVKEIRRVYVREEACIGCGFCEKVCPVNGRSAIVVEGIQPQVMVKDMGTTEEGHLSCVY